jgi:hypothetical protein
LSIITDAVVPVSQIRQGLVAKQAAPVAAPSAEAPPTEVPKLEDALSPKYAELARHQKMIRDSQLKFKAEKDAWEAQKLAEKAEFEKKYIARDRLKSDPYAVLTDEGIPYDTIVNAALQQDPQSKLIRDLQAKIDTLEGKFGESVKTAEERQKQDYAKAVDGIRQEIVELVDKDTNYEAIKANNAEEAVVSLIEEHYKKTGRILSVEDASQKVEDYLIEEALKMASLTKVKNKLNPPPLEVPEQKPVLNSAPIRTITNAGTTAPAKPMTKAERRARAIAVFQGKTI